MQENYSVEQNTAKSPDDDTQKLCEPDGVPPQSRKLPLGAVRHVTLLDGTTVALPVFNRFRKRQNATDASPDEAHLDFDDSSEGNERENESQLTHDMLALIRTAAGRKEQPALDATEAGWETIMSAVLSVLIRKGFVSREEIVEEIRKTCH